MNRKWLGGGYFGRWDVADRLQQLAVVEPVHPLERGERDGFEVAPGVPPGADLLQSPEQTRGMANQRLARELLARGAPMHFTVGELPRQRSSLAQPFRRTGVLISYTIT